MSFSFSHNTRRIWQGVVAIWLTLFVAVMALIVVFDIHRAEAVFNNHANERFQQANDRVRINELVLEGFVAMISAANDTDRTRIRVYAQQMLEQYPHIFEFEIVEKVSDDKLSPKLLPGFRG